MKEMVRNALRARFSERDFCLPNIGPVLRFLFLKRLPIERINSLVELFLADLVGIDLASSVLMATGSVLAAVVMAEADTAEMTVAGVPALSDGSSTSSTVMTVVEALSVSRSTVTAVSTLETIEVLVDLQLLFSICWAAALSNAACSRDDVLVATCTGDGGPVDDVFGKLSDEGGLSMLGDGMMMELSSMYLRSAVSSPTNMSYVTVLLLMNKLRGRPMLDDELSEMEVLVRN